jgi:hypothetical protein
MSIGPGIYVLHCHMARPPNKLDDFFALLDDQCENVKSFGPEAVFAVHYNNWKWFFQPEQKAKVMDAINSSFATHVWGHFFKQEIQWDLMRSHQAFHTIASQHCPKLFDTMIQVPGPEPHISPQTTAMGAKSQL